MTNKNYELNPLKWDSEYFELNSARVNLFGITDEVGQDEIIEFCKKYDFVTISNLNNIKENNHWIGNRTNAFLADMNVQFLKVFSDKPDYQDEKTYVANNLPRNEQILRIAMKSFNHSRFFNDPNLPLVLAKNVYLQWTESSFSQEKKYFVISEREGSIAGYALFVINKEDALIELIAVDDKYQGKKVGKSLIQSMESFVIDNGLNRIKVGTQFNNISAAQFYNAMGFKYLSCASIYHLWKI